MFLIIDQDLYHIFSAKLVIANANAIYAKQNIQNVIMQIQILIPPLKFVSSEKKKYLQILH